MALVNELKRDGSTLCDFEGGATGFQVLEGGWRPRVAQIRNGVAERVIEPLLVKVEGTSHNNLATYLQSLVEAQRWADAYHSEPTVDEPVWWHVKLDNETGERRALVYSITWGRDSAFGGGLEVGNVIYLEVEIERSGYWELTSYRQIPSETDFAWADMYDYTAADAGNSLAAHDIVGDVPARLQALWFLASAAGDELGRVWCGIRSAGRLPSVDAVAVADFANIWECEDGTNNASESGISDDAASDTNGASPGSGSGAYVEVTESDLEWDDTWHECLHLKLSDVTSDQAEQVGLHQWLLRAKVTSGTWEVQLRFGYEGMDDDEYIERKIVEVSSTSWDIYEMGLQQLPIRELQAVSFRYVDEQHESTFDIQIWARRTDDTGDGDLYLDCLMPIPTDEGFLKLWDAPIDATTEGVVFAEGPGGRKQVNVYSGNTCIQFTPFEENSLGLPPGDGRLIFVAARAETSDITDVYDVNGGKAGLCFERWLSLRGSE